MNSANLIRKCKKGKGKAQKALFERYVGLLHSVIQRYVSNQKDAEDVLLQAFLKIFQNLADFEYLNEPAFIGWMKKISINEALGHLRKEYKTLYKVENNEDLYTTNLVSPDVLEEKELIETIEQLPEGYRTVFLLHVVDGYAHKEIAENLGIAEATSRSQFFKARNLLKKKLGNDYGRALGT